MDGSAQLKSPAGVWNEGAAAAAKDPPSSFAAFALTPLDPPEAPGRLEIVYFAVACKTCGNDRFHLGAFPTGATTTWSAPDQPVLRPPHRLKCAQCGETNMLFNPQTDGYNGRLCGGSDQAPGGPAEAFASNALKTYVAPTYNIWFEELEEIAEQEGGAVKATDLFDWINIIQSTPEKDYYLELSYECA